MKQDKTKKINKSKFETFYFKGYYKKIGDFSRKRDKELINWFKGIFNIINFYYPIKKGENKRLLEYGCATGAAASVLRDYGWKVTSTDISKYAVSRAKKNFKGINFLVQNMEKPFRKGKFDVVMALDVIEHLPSPEIGIKNAYKVLNKNGVAIFSTPNDYKQSWNDPTHLNVKNPNEWKKILREIGFKNIFIKQVALIPYFYRWNWRLTIAFPFAVNLKYIISPVILIAKK